MNKQKVVLLTGATSGIGLAAAKLLAKKGFHILAIGRSKDKCYNAISAIRNEQADANVRFFTADLSSQQDIAQVCNNISDYLNETTNGVLDVLVNNAGVFTTYYTLTNEGIEMQFAVNHLSHFMITNLLIKHLEKSADARILTTSSGSHYGAKINFTDLMFSKNYRQLKAYKQSKLANVMFTNELNRRFESNHSIRAFAIDPGLVNTSMGNKQTSGLANWIWKKRRKHGVSTEEGCETIVYLASEPLDSSYDCYYFKDCKPKLPNKRSNDLSTCQRLWKISEKLCNFKGVS